MQKLLQGVVEFKKEDFESHRLLFEKIGKQQKPHTLFIGCSDSRIVPNLITKTLPGELFVIRNIGNFVPPYRETKEYVSTTSAIEYAIQVLDVENIVICGHSNCGACSCLYQDDSFFKRIPHVKKWLELAENIKEQVFKKFPEHDPSSREWLTEQMNIVEQMKHLLSYPFIKERYEQKKLSIYGWYYIIETGEIYNYNKEKGFFEIIE